FFGPDTCDPSTRGRCVVPSLCDGPPSPPVCLCDGKVLEGASGACVAQNRTADPSLCAKGTFACGDRTCKRNQEVSVEKSGGPEGAPPSYDCMTTDEIGGHCTGIPDCSCLDLMSLGCFDPTCCSADADHQETVSIALP